jgi:hypothetical protein
MKLFTILIFILFSQNLLAGVSSIREEKLKKINDTFVKEVTNVTKLKPEQIREFLPGKSNFGKKIGEIYKLNLEQTRAVNQLEDQRRNAMFELRKKFGKDKSRINKIKTKN